MLGHPESRRQHRHVPRRVRGRGRGPLGSGLGRYLKGRCCRTLRESL